MIKFLLSTQTDELSAFISQRLLAHINYGQVNKYECYAHESLISFDWYNIHDFDQKPSRITIYLTREHIFFICANQACLDRMPAPDNNDESVDRVLYIFFSELIKGDIDYLEELEEQITGIEDQVISDYKNFKHEYAGDIIDKRRELLKLKRYYEQLNDIFEGLMGNENDVISGDDLRYFRILDSKIDRLYAHVLNLRDYVTQVREAYQAQIDIEQNSLMKIFTVITSIFMPLTLIVGWYGMNLRMPEITWDYAYPFVIVLSIAVVVVSIIVFKRRKWF